MKQNSPTTTMTRKNVKVSKEIDFILCDFVERNPPLWNPEDKNYHKSDIREELFDSLSKAVKIPGINLKERWGAIRHTFTKNVRKVELSRRESVTGEPLYKPSWPLFEKLLFLYDVVRRNLNKVKVNKSWIDETNLSHSMLMDGPFKHEFDIKIEETEPCSSSMLQLNTPEDTSSSYMRMTPSQDDEESTTFQRKRRAREDSTDNIQFLHPSDVMSNMTIDTQDECDTFGRLVVAKLKRMNENDAAEAQIEILQILKKYLKN